MTLMDQARGRQETQATKTRAKERASRDPVGGLKHPAQLPLDADRLLQLHRTAGNAAVTSLVVQRYEPGEHARMGALPGDKEPTVNLGKDKPGKAIIVTYGEIIALGDYFENVDEMKKEARNHPDRFAKLIALIRKDEASRGRPRLVSEKQWDEADPEYIKLATKNESHFAPSSPAVGFEDREKNHKTEWYFYHRQALWEAYSGRKNDALISNAFGDHFLTDAFSAGHLINKKAVMVRARERMADDKTAAKFALMAAIRVLAQAPYLRDYQVNLSIGTTIWEDVNEVNLARLILFVREHNWMTDEAFLNNFAKAVHDRLNRSVVSHAEGVHVTVPGLGDPILLAGDTTLDESPDTIKAAQEAVTFSRWQVEQIVPSPKGPQPDAVKLAEAVWAMVPVPTMEGKKYIDKVVDELTRPATTIDDPSVVAFAGVMIENMEALIKKLHDKGRLQKNPAGAQAPAPHPAPAPPTPVPVP